MSEKLEVTTPKVVEKTPPELPKSREIFTGDINDAVIRVQKITGFEITPEWWGEQVGNHGTTEEILDRFDTSFEVYVHGEMVAEAFKPSEKEDGSHALDEARAELNKFDQKYGTSPGTAPLRKEFLDALDKYLSEKYFDTNLADSVTKILLSGTSDYNIAEQQRLKDEDPKTGITELYYESVSGRKALILGTTHVYDANSHEIKYLDNIVSSISEDSTTTLILEGQYGESGSVPEAIRAAGGEFSYMASLAKQKGIEVVPGEPDPHQTAEEILATNSEISRDDIALHYGLKTLKGAFNEKGIVLLKDVAPFVHHSVGIAGEKENGGWVNLVTTRQEVVDLTEGQKQGILDEMPEVIQQLNAHFARVKPGEKLISLDPEGLLHLEYDLDKPPILWDPSPEQMGDVATVLTQISRLDMLMRDRHTMGLMHDALIAGKNTIIAVGGSHLSALRPALDSYFATSKR